MTVSPDDPAPEIRTVASREVYRNRWLVLREDDIVRADGTPGIHAVVVKSDSAVVVPLHDDDTFTLVEQYRYTVGIRRLEFPQGSWETRPDADGLTVAAGELAEETGLTASSLRPLGLIHHAYGYSGQLCHVVLATGLVEGAPRREQEEQGMTTRRVRRGELEQLILDGQVSDAATLAAYQLLVLRERAGQL
jgi:ADP-ribose pyrophosphatase